MTQTMLFTKRLTSFLSQNTTAQLPTLLLISPTGKLLSSSSPLPASALRTQSTLACTLWNLYHSNGSDLLSTTLPAVRGEHKEDSASKVQDHDLSSITIQLNQGIMVIRALKCSLLFVALGPLSVTTASANSSALHSPTKLVSSSSFVLPPSSPTPPDGQESTAVGNHVEREAYRDTSETSLRGLGSGAPSETGSVTSTERTQAPIMAARRHAEEVGRWLETSLDGLVLSSGEGR